MHKCNFILKGKNGKASGNHGSNKLHRSGGLIPWARLLGEVFPRFFPFMSSSWSPCLWVQGIPICFPRKHCPWSPPFYRWRHRTAGPEEIGGLPLWKTGWVYRPPAGCPHCAGHCHTGLLPSCTLSFPWWGNPLWAICLAQRKSLGGEYGNHCPPRDVATLFVSSPGSGTAEGPQLCWERN